MSWRGRSAEEIGLAVLGFAEICERDGVAYEEMRCVGDALAWCANPETTKDEKMAERFLLFDRAVKVGKEYRKKRGLD